MARLEPIDVKVFGVEYKIGRLDLFDALHVERVLAPILTTIFHESVEAIADAVVASKNEEGATVEEKLNEVANLFVVCRPILRDIAELPRSEFEGVVKICLGCVERKMEHGYARLCRDGQIMFDDLDQQTVLVLVARVLIREIRPTFAAFLGSTFE